MIGVITVIMGVIVIGIIKMTGKRKLIILALLGTGLSSTGLSIYARLHVPDSVSSYDPATFPVEKSYIPQALLYSLAVFTGLCIPWVLLGEMFPFKYVNHLIFYINLILDFVLLFSNHKINEQISRNVLVKMMIIT